MHVWERLRLHAYGMKLSCQNAPVSLRNGAIGPGPPVRLGMFALGAAKRHLAAPSSCAVDAAAVASLAPPPVPPPTKLLAKLRALPPQPPAEASTRVRPSHGERTAVR